MSDLIFSSHPILISVFLLLIFMSFISWYVIIYKAIKLFGEYRAYKNFKLSYLINRNWLEKKEFNNIDGCVKLLIDESKQLKNIIAKHQDKSSKSDILEVHLAQTLDNIRFKLDKGLTILASIGSSAPFIGLFGTVIGIFFALEKISIQGNAGVNVVAGPMGEALIATAVGLFAAIPAVLAYNMFIRLNKLLIQNLRHVAEQITIYLANE